MAGNYWLPVLRNLPDESPGSSRWCGWRRTPRPRMSGSAGTHSAPETHTHSLFISCLFDITARFECPCMPPDYGRRQISCFGPDLSDWGHTHLACLLSCRHGQVVDLRLHSFLPGARNLILIGTTLIFCHTHHRVLLQVALVECFYK